MNPPTEAQRAISIDLLIECVRFRPCLWNKNHANYMSSTIRTNNWGDICQELCLTGTVEDGMFICVWYDCGNSAVTLVNYSCVDNSFSFCGVVR